MTNEPTRTILLVEDQDALRKFVTLMLERRGFQVLQASDGVEALDVFEAAPALDLVIVDMVLPRMSGLDVAAELVRRSPDIKLLYISGYSGSIAMDSMIRRSPEKVLLKPFTERSLVDRVFQLLELPPVTQSDGAV